MNHFKMLPKYSDENAGYYYEVLRHLTPADLEREWREISEERYTWLLECLPPVQHKQGAFMVGEKLTHTELSAQLGPMYEAVVAYPAPYVKGARYFSRPDYLARFNPTSYVGQLLDLYPSLDKEYFKRIGLRGGKSRSEAKVAAARENGKRGGRPRKVVTA